MISPLPRLLRRLSGISLPADTFRPFYINGCALGQVNRRTADALRRWPALFTVTADSVTLASHPDTSAALAEVAHALYADGLFSGWRNETYAVATHFGAAPLFHLERAAMRVFGLTMHAVHINGVIGDYRDSTMWLARRSADKPIDPGLYDTLVGGGLASGMSIAATAVKESWEEAGVPATLACQARPAGAVRVRRAVPEGWHDEVIFVHDLWLPSEFEPANQDGEVSSFVRLPLPDILQLISDTDQITVDASFILCDFLIRSGFFPPEQPDYLALQALLHAG